MSAFDQPFAQTPTGAAIAPVVVGALNKVGWALQPFQGFQQGLVMAPLALATGRPEQAVDALKAGVSYLGYGSAEQLPGFENARGKAVQGRTIFKNAGAPDWLADSAGLALDFFGDPTNLLGGAGLLAKTAGTVAKAPRLVTAGQSVIRVADELGAPVRTAFRAIPKPVRETIARNTWKYTFGLDAPVGVIPFLARTTGRERASIAEAILPPEIARRLAPEDQTKVIDFVGELKRQEQKTLAEYGQRAQGLADAFAQATGGLRKPQVDALAAILSRLSAAPTRTAWRSAHAQLKDWATATGDPTRYERALKAYGDGVRFDLWAGQGLVDAGKLGQDDLMRNLAFPGGKLNEGTERRGTIRRAFSFFDDPDAWLDKLRAENRPARVSLDPVRLKARLERTADEAPVARVPDASIPFTDAAGSVIDPRAANKLVNKRVTVQYEAVSDFDYAALDLGNLDAKDVQRLRSAARAVEMPLDIRKVGGRWKASGRGPMTFNHPVINEYLDADEMKYLAGVKGSDGSASRPVTTIEAVETMPVPAWFDPEKGGDALAALEAHRFDLENGAGVGYLTGDEMARVFKDASPEESDAISEAIERFGMSGPKDDWFPVDTTDPRVMSALARSADPKADLLRNLAAGKAAKDTAFQAAIKATPDVLVSSVQEFFDANPEAPLADGLAHALKTNGITDGRRATAFVRAVLDDADPGVYRSPSSRETVWKLQERLLEQDAVTVQGGGAPGSLAVGATRVSARQQLSEQILREYGQIEDYRAQYVEQARVVGEVVARRTALERTKQFMIDEGGMYWPQLAQQINAGRLDSSKLPAELNNLPVDPSGFKVAGGFRTITVQDARGLDGVFSAGDVVPDSLYRVITAGKNVQGAALPVMLRVLNNDWKGIKIGNPATAVVNILSAVPMSDHYGIGLGELVQGATLYATKGKREWLEEMSERGIGDVDGLSNEVRLEAARLREELARAPMTRWDRLNGIVKAYFDFTGESIGTRPGSMPAGPLRTLARFGNPLTGFGLTRGLLNANQLSDNFVRGSVYHARRASGASPDEAARAAREVLLDYAARPLMVEFGSKSGLDPFATFRYLSAYRVLSTMYDRPTRLARYYRVADSVSDRSDPERQERELKAAQAYVLEKQPARLTTDSSGRGVYVPFANFFPEGTVTDLIDDPNASNFLGFIPKAPLLAMIETVSTGIGFRGMNPYDGLIDQGGFFEAFEKDKVEAVRRAMKVLWRYGASPMMPGQPAMEEIARSVARTARTTAQLAEDAGVSETVMREALKVLEEGPFAWGRQGSLPVAATRGESLSGEPARDPQWAIARALGLKTYDVQGDLTQPGAARNTVRGGSFELQNRKQYLTNLLAKARRDGMPPAEYERMRAGIIEELNRLAQELADKANGLR